MRAAGVPYFEVAGLRWAKVGKEKRPHGPDFLLELSGGALARTRTWNHRLGGSSYILFNYEGRALSMPKVSPAVKNLCWQRPQS
jgi:hypothetical protein